MIVPKSKIFKDNVHGCISIPQDYVDGFIDTEIFQRLRSIGQTGMGVLYPSARHDYGHAPFLTLGSISADDQQKPKNYSFFYIYYEPISENKSCSDKALKKFLKKELRDFIKI